MEISKCIICNSSDSKKSYIKGASNKSICSDCAKKSIETVFNYTRIPSRDNLSSEVKKLYEKNNFYYFIVYIVFFILLFLILKK